MKKNILTIVLIVTILINIISAVSQEYAENTGRKYNYDLSSINILIILGDDYDYYECIKLKTFWEDWGAEVDLAGTEAELTGHLLQQTDQGWDTSETEILKMDLLLPEIYLSSYNAVFFPGGNSPKNLLKNDSLRITQIVQEADRKGIILAGICHGPHVLAAAGVIKDLSVTGHPDIIRIIRKNGGNYVRRVCVVDENLITGNWPYFETMAVTVAEKLLYPEGGGPSESSPFKTNQVLKNIRGRRSIRRFLDRDIDPDTVKILLRAATWAPSANNDQPWRFVVVRDTKIKDSILKALINEMKDFYEKKGYPLDRIKIYWQGILSAPVHIFAFCDTRDIEFDEGFEDIEKLHNMQGVSAACQNILLAAQSLGLGSVWAGGLLVVEDKIKTFLQVPEGIRLAAVISLGYPAYKALPPVRKPLSEVVFQELWNEK